MRRALAVLGYCFWKVFAQKVPRGMAEEKRGEEKERKRQGGERERRKGKKGQALPEF